MLIISLCFWQSLSWLLQCKYCKKWFSKLLLFGHILLVLDLTFFPRGKRVASKRMEREQKIDKKKHQFLPGLVLMPFLMVWFVLFRLLIVGKMCNSGFPFEHLYLSRFQKKNRFLSYTNSGPLGSVRQFSCPSFFLSTVWSLSCSVKKVSHSKFNVLKIS